MNGVGVTRALAQQKKSPVARGRFHGRGLLAAFHPMKFQGRRVGSRIDFD